MDTSRAPLLVLFGTQRTFCCASYLHVAAVGIMLPYSYLSSAALVGGRSEAILAGAQMMGVRWALRYPNTDARARFAADSLLHRQHSFCLFFRSLCTALLRYLALSGPRALSLDLQMLRGCLVSIVVASSSGPPFLTTAERVGLFPRQ